MVTYLEESEIYGYGHVSFLKSNTDHWYLTKYFTRYIWVIYVANFTKYNSGQRNYTRIFPSILLFTPS